MAGYVVGIPRAVVAARGGEAWLRDRIAEALAARELCVVRRIDGIGKRVDVRDFLRSIAISEAGAESLARAGVVGDLIAVSVEVDVRGSGGVKIAEVVEAIFDPELPNRAVRVALGKRLPDRVVSPLELAPCRKPRTPVAITTEDASGP